MRCLVPSSGPPSFQRLMFLGFQILDGSSLTLRFFNRFSNPPRAPAKDFGFKMMVEGETRGVVEGHSEVCLPVDYGQNDERSMWKKEVLR